ncbi:hypothetical protein LGH70_23095 [Hymenobacter sp. BT635]|uniref:Uncharacterized protein n=1 Tax=Hymenobacter nitidus TaxID=2880929 RepID=A0ABS8ANE2_9BACT|nr:hypothetical protein [Hymenobacter nitidus]MCB2380499.1 hypothetical protein [Hymenobacter nitidus]
MKTLYLLGEAPALLASGRSAQSLPAALPLPWPTTGRWPSDPTCAS